MARVSSPEQLPCSAAGPAAVSSRASRMFAVARKKKTRNDSAAGLTNRCARNQGKGPMNLAIPDVRTLEIHPPTIGYVTASCQRSSGRAGNDLGVPPFLQGIRDAAALGYNFLSIGGEQSLFHASLAALCHEARQVHMLTT